MILKVLSSEMDQAEIRFIQKDFIKERGAEIFRKIRPSPVPREPLKDSALPGWPFIYYILFLARAL